jgi:putative ABC transport system permease protein
MNRRKRMMENLDQDIRDFIERETRDNIERGMPPEEARYAALRKFGNVARVKEDTWEVWTFGWLEQLWHDIRYGLRQLRRNPGFTAVAVLTLALGIGANTAIFSLTNAVMLRALPVQQPQELVQAKFHLPQRTNLRRTYTNPLWEQVRDHQNVFSGVFAWSPDTFDLANGGQADYVSGTYASGAYFTTLGVRPAVGRLLNRADDIRGCPGAVVLGYGFWQEHYGGAESAIGSLLRLDGHPFPVIGVAQLGFFGTDVGERFDVALPICAEAIIKGEASSLDVRNDWWLLIMGRLKPGVTNQQATAGLNLLAHQIFGSTVPPKWPSRLKQLFRQYVFATLPAATGVTGFLAEPRREYKRPLEILLVVVGLVLLVACANIASLMLARASTRQKEIAMRLSLGASRARVVRQLLTESILLSGAGAVVGVLFSRWAGPLLVRLVSTQGEAVFLDLSLDTRVLGFTLAIAVFTGLLFGIWPATRTTRVSLTYAMKGGEATAGKHLFPVSPGRGIVVSQLALSLVLLVGTGLFLRTFRNLLTLNPGFDRHNVMLVSMRVQDAGIPANARLSFYTRVLERLKTIPAAVSVSQVRFTPFSGAEWNNDIQAEGYQPRQGEEPLVWFNSITEEYFATLHTPLLAGRTFDSRDTATSQPVAIVNRTMASHFFPHQNPIGRYFRISDSGDPNATQPLQIVGVVKDSKYESLREAPLPFAYVPLAQMHSLPEESSFVIRSGISPSSLIPTVRDAIGGIDKAATVQFTTLAEQVDNSLTQERLLAVLSGFFGLLALLLTAIGVYGVMAYLVTQRTREIGIRLALGAQPTDVVKVLIAEGLRLTLAGVSIGLLAAVGLTRFLSSLLYGIRPTDPLTFTAVGVVLAGVALLACYTPARRATKVDPMATLRYE